MESQAETPAAQLTPCPPLMDPNQSWNALAPAGSDSKHLEVGGWLALMPP